MTSKLTITDERIEKIAVWLATESHSLNLEMLTCLRELQERRKAERDSEPVGYFGRFDPDDEDLIDQCSKNVKGAFPLYRHAQQPIVDADDNFYSWFGREWHENYQHNQYTTAAKQMLGVMAESAWKAGHRAAMLQAGTFRENGNSSTNNFRGIAETSTGTAITPAAPDKKLTDDVLDEIIAGAKTSMEQYLALSLKAEREVWRKEGPTDDERIMAIEGMHSCEWCSDEGWVVGEMGITRCACNQAGNSPVIPEGYVMVPMRLTAENGAKGVLSGEFSETKFVNCPECFGDDECETCDGSGRIEIKVPVSWTTIKDIWIKGVEHFAAAPQENI